MTAGIYLDMFPRVAWFLHAMMACSKERTSKFAWTCKIGQHRRPLKITARLDSTETMESTASLKLQDGFYKVPGQMEHSDSKPWKCWKQKLQVDTKWI